MPSKEGVLMASRPMARTEIHTWRPYSSSDIRIIEEQLDRVDAVTFLLSGDVIHCSDVLGQTVMRVRPGYIEFPKATIPDGMPPEKDWMTLSTFQWRDADRPQPLQSNQVCPHCHMQLPLSGRCDCRD